MRNKLASSIAILLNYGAKWRLLYYVFYVLCLLLELSIILNGHTGQAAVQEGSTSASETDSKLDESIQFKGIFNIVLGLIDLGKFSMSVASMYGLVSVAVCLQACLLGSIAFGLSSIVRRFAWTVRAAVLMSGFLVLFWIQFLSRLSSCREQTIIVASQKSADETSSLFVPAYWQDKYGKIKYVKEFRSDIQIDISCLSSNYILIQTLSVVALLTAIGLAAVYFKLTMHTLTSRLPVQASYSGLLHLIAVATIPIIRLMVLYTYNSEMTYRIHLIVSIIVMIFSFLFQRVSPQFADSTLNTLQSIKVCLLLTASILTLIQYELADSQDKMSSLTKNTLHIVEFLVVALAIRLSMIIRVGILPAAGKL